MKNQFFVQRHEIEGEMGFECDGERVKFFCRWPFDRSTDEWIQISNAFPRHRYVAAIRRLAKNGRAGVRGVKFGSMALEVCRGGKIRLRVHDSNRFSPEQLDFPIDAVPQDLLPSYDKRKRSPSS